MNEFVNPYKDIPTENKTDDFLISSDYFEEQQQSEEESMRNLYSDAFAEDYVDETIIANLCTVYVSTKEKTSSKGNTYTSNLCITKVFIDEEEVKIAFFDEMFNNYDERKNRITVMGNHPIAEIVRGLTGNTQHNRFIIDLDKFQEKLSNIEQMRIRIYQYMDNGYERSSFKVLAFSEK